MCAERMAVTDTIYTPAHGAEEVMRMGAGFTCALPITMVQTMESTAGTDTSST